MRMLTLLKLKLKSKEFFQMFIKFLQNKFSKTVAYIAVILTAVYLSFSVIKTQSMNLLVYILAFNVIIMIANFIRDRKDRPTTGNNIHLKGMIFFLLTYLTFSMCFRIYTILIYNVPFNSFTFLLNDFSSLRFAFPILVMIQTAFLISSFFNIKGKKLSDIRIYTTLSLLFVAFIAFLWGWYPAINKPVGLEFLYLRDMKDISYDYAYLVIFFLISPFLYHRVFHSQDISYKKETFQNVLAIFILPPALIITFHLTSGIQNYKENNNLYENGKYTLKYNDLVERDSFNKNPLQYFLSNSLSEYLRIKGFGQEKRLLPFFVRPNLNLSKTEIENYIQQNLASDEKIISKDFPAFRFKEAGDTSKKPNVVVIVLETLEESTSDSFKGRETPLKFIEELKKDSLYCEHCFANSEASYEGESAISSSLPIWGVVSAKNTGLITHSLSSSYLKILKKRGYSSEFSTTWDSTANILTRYQKLFLSLFPINKDRFKTNVDFYSLPFMIAGIENISPLFDNFLSYDDLDPDINLGDTGAEKTDGRIHGVWYVHDEYGYDKLYKKMISAEKPFFIVTHTESSHPHVPIPRGHRPDHPLTTEERFYYSTRYADFALREFFDKVKKNPVYENTIFVLISDHTSIDRKLSLYDHYHIPFLIHAPGILSPQKVDQPAFQIDVGPTLLNILNFGGEYTSFGRNLHAPVKKAKKRGMILPNWDGYLVFVLDPYIARVDVNNVYEIYNFRKDKHLNLIDNKEIKKDIDELHREFLINYQIIGDTMYSNRIMPQRDLK